MRLAATALVLGSFTAMALAYRPQILDIKDGEPTWQERHMKEEHGVDQFDALSFFTLHDSDNSKTWTTNDILNLYGLLKDIEVGDGTGMGTKDESQKITQETKDYVLSKVLELMDYNQDGIISLDEWRVFTDRGGQLPDFGLGPGHHGDYEHEYEVHHWMEFHAKDDPDVKNVHPEDIEHERLYHAYEHNDDSETHKQEKGSWARIENIPQKFRVIN